MRFTPQKDSLEVSTSYICKPVSEYDESKILLKSSCCYRCYNERCGLHIYLFTNVIKLAEDSFQLDSNSMVEDPEERRAHFILEFENPFKCGNCGERFRQKKQLREHKKEVHSY
jgi:hypothetical protein